MLHLVTSQEMARLDRMAIDGLSIPGATLMENAGRAVAAYCATRLRAGARVVVACGTGNNGGDGFVVARVLATAGYPTDVVVAGARERIQGDPAIALHALERTRAPWSLRFGLEGLGGLLADAALVVDALLGTGVRADVRGVVADAIAGIERGGCEVIAVDLPSGVDGDTGAILGAAVHADATVAFAFPKRGHCLHPGAACVGDLHVADIGIPHALAEQVGIDTFLVREADGPALLPARSSDAHKGMFGHVLVAAGSPTRPGAAILALRGALRAGAGLVSWSADDATWQRAPDWPAEAMLHVRGEPIPPGVSAIVAGPGWGMERMAELADLGVAALPMCLDADALTLLAATPELWAQLPRPLIVTPHPKEMARLMGSSVAAVQAERVASARSLAKTRDVVVVLKGAGTVVAAPTGRVAVVGAGCAALATGGTGDVLAGVIGALLAQRLDAWSAACLGALAHAVAGDLCSQRHGLAGTTATDVAEVLGSVWARWQR